MILIQYALLLLVFALELAALAAYAYWGFHFGQGWALKLALGLGTPLLVAVVWGLFLAPKASVPLPPAPRLLLKTLVFGFAAAALYAAGRGKLGVTFAAVALIAHALSYALGEPPSE